MPSSETPKQRLSPHAVLCEARSRRLARAEENGTSLGQEVVTMPEAFRPEQGSPPVTVGSEVYQRADNSATERLVVGSIGGLILDKTVSDPNLAGIVVYAPVINGIGGNLVAIQSSRISTHLHFHCIPGEVPEEAKGCYYPCRTFCGSGANHRSAQVLLLLVVPGHLIFLYTIHLMKSGHTTHTPIFKAVYLTAALLQVFALLCIADWMVHCMWKNSKDPDSFSIPYLTALGDLLGTAMLALCFHFLWLIGDQDSDVGD
ncbi:solute carrier family 41 member 2-like [Polypterus senegalus]|uniref:solute carrier family 41 member 2-like n=1 Tax=Polypterus senegalus TaxID=55291 RepID=UPI001963B80A|nr:solute carrier family 41 member 2-like [Polypterus senegalus]